MMLLGKFAIGIAGTALLAGAVVSSEGFIHVRVYEKHPGGTHLRLMVPAMLVPVSLKFVPQQNLKEAAANVKPWLPLIDATMSGLADCPDGALVEVTDSNDHVSVVKAGSSLVVDVDDPDETVHVSVPVQAMRRAVDELAESGGTI